MASDDTLTRCTTPYKVHTAASVEKRWGSLFFRGLRLTLTLPAKGVASLLIRSQYGRGTLCFLRSYGFNRCKLTGTAIGGYPEPEP
jgi:hypothetical protein